MGNKSSKSRNRGSTKSITAIENEEEINETDLTNTTNETENLKEFRDYFNSDDNNIYREHDHYFLKKHLFQCAFSSPIEEVLTNSGKVLDLGCGNGSFLLDIATNYPNSECVGIDVEPLFPSEIKPKNLTFQIADIFQRLPFSDNEFDLVHLDSMLFTTTTTQLIPLINEMLRVTKPNGYIEFAEVHQPTSKNANFNKFKQLIDGFVLVADFHGTEKDIILKLPDMLTANPNITNVTVKDKTIIIGKNDENDGNLGILIMQILFEWFSSDKSIAKQLNMTDEQYDQLVKDARDELDHISPEIDFYRVYAQKMS